MRQHFVLPKCGVRAFATCDNGKNSSPWDLRQRVELQRDTQQPLLSHVSKNLRFAFSLEAKNGPPLKTTI